MSQSEAPKEALPTILKLSAESAAPIRALFEGEHAPRLIKRDVLRHLRQINAQLEESKARAEEVLERAHTEGEAIRAEALEQARQEVVREHHQALERARERYERVIQEAEGDIIALAVEVAERIIHQSIALDEQTLKRIVVGSLELVRDKRQITVLVHPEDLARMQAWRLELLEHVDTTALFFEDDESLERGDCLIETEAGRVDARLSVQLESFKRALMP